MTEIQQGVKQNMTENRGVCSRFQLITAPRAEQSRAITITHKHNHTYFSNHQSNEKQQKEQNQQAITQGASQNELQKEKAEQNSNSQASGINNKNSQSLLTP